MRKHGAGSRQSSFPADDWHRLCEYYDARNWGHGHRKGFICPSTRSIHAYQFNAHLYGLTPSQAVGPTYRGFPTDTTVAVYETGFVTGTPAGPHLRGYNVAYCDGHSKWQRGPLSQVKGAAMTPPGVRSKP